MKSKTLSSITAMTLFVALAMPVRPAAQEQPQQEEEQLRYSVTDLGTPGETFSAAYSVNSGSWVAGAANVPDNTAQHAALWRKGQKTDLGTLGGPNSTAFFPLNDKGEVSGFSDTTTPDPFGEDFCGFGTHLICRPFVWKKGAVNRLPTLGGDNAIANEINNRAQIGGVAETTIPDPTCLPPQVLQAVPVLWEEHEIEELPTFPGDPDGFVNAINDIGQAVGASGKCYTALPGIHALLWQNGSATDLGNLGGTWNHFPQDINNEGHVVGFSNLRDNTTTHAFLWQNGVMNDLGTLPGDFSSFAFGINSKGQVVGQSCSMNFSVCRAFLSQDGTMTDLNNLIPARSPLSLLVAFNINSRGEIVGEALQISTGEVHAFLARPCERDDVNTEGCRNDDADTPRTRSGTNESPKVTLPDNVRKLLQRRLPFGRVGAGPMRPQ